MSKLVIKQNLPELSMTEKLESLLRVVLPLLLFVIAISAALLLYLSRVPDEPVMLGSNDSLTVTLPPAYTQEAQHLKTLVREFEVQEHTGVEEYAKHARLVSQAEALLAQLGVMDARVADLAVTPDTKAMLLTRHQYQKDYWEAKRVFHDLRLSRFDEPLKAPSPLASTTITSVEATPTAPESPPENANLPKDFCPLFGPGAAACRPDAKDKP